MKRGNFDLLSGYSCYVPGFSGLFYLLLMFLLGALIGNLIIIPFTLIGGIQFASEYGMVVSYPCMFIPAMFYARHKSLMAALDEPEVAVDACRFGMKQFLGLALLCVVTTLAMSFISDGITALLPQMPSGLSDVMSSITHGNFILNFISVSVFAPFFEEWLCRGMVLRGLLNCERKDGSRGYHPAFAIVVSAAFFALIHLNIWQAVPAFLLGCVFGLVYWKTGSLKLTMLMHFTNNTLALILGNIESFSEAESWLDILQPVQFAIICSACVLLVILSCMRFLRLK